MRDMNLNDGKLADFSYVIGTTILLDGEAEAGLVRSALLRLIERHESLRTGFRLTAEGLQQVIGPAPERVDLPEFEVATEAEAKAVIHDVWGRSFPVDATSLFRPFLIRLGGERTLLVLCVEHLIGDVAALRVLATQFTELYDRLRSGADANGEPETFLQFNDWARNQRLQVDNREHDEIAFWRSELGEDGPFPRYSVFHPLEGVERAAKRSVGRFLDKDDLERVDELAATRRMSRFMVLLYAIHTSLMVALRQDTIVVHSSVANRTTRESRSMVGWCAHGLPFRSSIAEGRSLGEHLLTTRRRIFEVLRHQFLPLTRIVYHLSPDAHGSQRGLRPPRIFFAFDDRSRNNDPNGPVYLDLDEATDNGAKQFAQPGLTFAATVRDTGVDLGLVFGEGRFSADLAEQIIGLVPEVLAWTADKPERGVSEFRAAHNSHDLKNPKGWESS